MKINTSIFTKLTALQNYAVHNGVTMCRPIYYSVMIMKKKCL